MGRKQKAGPRSGRHIFRMRAAAVARREFLRVISFVNVTLVRTCVLRNVLLSEVAFGYTRCR